MALTFGSLFAGIGGFDIGLEAAGMVCKWQVEIDPFAVAVLEKNWPAVERWRDIKDFNPNRSLTVDVICGGFPCQDISLAGSGEGLDGKRSGLWSEYFRIVSKLRPKYVIVENVSALLRRGIDRVLGDLASLGYGAEWQTVLASDFGLPHRRERVFIVAYPDKIIRSKRKGLGAVPDGSAAVFAAGSGQRTSIWVQTADRFIGVDDGISREAYSHRACGIGNAVIPSAAEWVGRKVIEHHSGLYGSDIDGASI
jgi:DNA (cytosine-5)-methyltransferase 1